MRSWMGLYRLVLCQESFQYYENCGMNTLCFDRRRGSSVCHVADSSRLWATCEVKSIPCCLETSSSSLIPPPPWHTCVYGTRVNVTWQPSTGQRRKWSWSWRVGGFPDRQWWSSAPTAALCLQTAVWTWKPCGLVLDRLHSSGFPTKARPNTVRVEFWLCYSWQWNHWQHYTDAFPCFSLLIKISLLSIFSVPPPRLNNPTIVLI